MLLQGLNVYVNLQLSLSSILLVTYLPTLLMNIINQATVYSSVGHELIITVNITCMMVLTSVYLSVSSSLPNTPDIKPVEKWLLYNLAYPFLVIISNIIMEVIVDNFLYFCYIVKMFIYRGLLKIKYKKVWLQ